MASYSCDPILHNGRKIEAVFFVREVSDEEEIADPRAYACCRDHLSEAVEFVLASGHEAKVRHV